MKQGGVILSHGGFILPSSLISFEVLPLHFQLDYGALPELHLSLVQYMKGFMYKIPFQVQLVTSTNRSHVQYHIHNSLLRMHGKHYELLCEKVNLVHMPLSLSWLVSKRVHKISVPALRTSPSSMSFSLLLLLSKHVR